MNYRSRRRNDEFSLKGNQKRIHRNSMYDKLSSLKIQTYSTHFIKTDLWDSNYTLII